MSHFIAQELLVWDGVGLKIETFEESNNKIVLEILGITSQNCCEKLGNPLDNAQKSLEDPLQ